MRKSNRRPAAGHPFAALREWKAGARSATGAPPSKAAGTKAADPKSAEQEAGVDVAEHELFLKAVGAVRPIDDGDRALIERPRPAPLPRSRADEAQDERTPARKPVDPLRAAYADVTPLRDSGRIELLPASRNRPARGDGPLLHGGDFAEAVDVAWATLPPEVDRADPGALFRHMTRGAKPIDDRNRVALEVPPPLPVPLKHEADERAALDESLSAPFTLEDRLETGDETAFLRPGLPRRILTDLRRGRWTLQGQLDLHGLNRDEARTALTQYLSASLQRGDRFIRVIHGKGNGSPGRFSVLKELSRGWLAQREEILAFCQAGPHDGGAGALLVLMRAQKPMARP
ncbi:Smr/MutS family protein [Thauera phenolivorans]|uniref:Smr/MutS family protein n=1 Tax=Thauera phenolivorans TaxID=1792543 RepID=UPI00083B422D|nr:Smr/MutS family protein [Thauera phenolivorans]